MVEKVLVAVDGGRASHAAIAWVADRAQTVHLQVEIVSVAELDDTRAESAMSKALEAFHAARPTTAASKRILHGPPEQALILASHHADLLVIGAHPTGGAAKAFSTTLPLKVAGHSACMTVVVPVSWEAIADSIVAGWSDNAASGAALTFAADEADRLDRTLVVVHTWTLPDPAVDPSADALAVEELAHVHEQLVSEAVAKIRKEYPALRVASTIEIGDPATAIARAAAHSALVVVGSRGRGPIKSLLLGSVSHGLLVSLPAPVAVWPSLKRGLDVYPDLVDDDSL